MSTLFIKTPLCLIGHESVETTLNVYSHATEEGMRMAANRIDMAMGIKSAIKTENNATEKEVGQYTEINLKSRHERNLSLVRANIEGKEQARYIRLVKTCGKDGIRQIIV